MSARTMHFRKTRLRQYRLSTVWRFDVQDRAALRFQLAHTAVSGFLGKGSRRERFAVVPPREPSSYGTATDRDG